MRVRSRRTAGLLAVLTIVAGLLVATAVAGSNKDDRADVVPGTATTPSRPSPTGTASVSPNTKSPDRDKQSGARSQIRWRRSVALGEPWAGRLVRGVKLPPEGRLFFTWDPVRHESPNRAYRRHATARLIRLILRVLRSHAEENPDAPRAAIGDLSRPHGGDFGRRFGSPDHESHQNGLDVDIYYPRLDRREREPRRPAQIDRELSQDLVDRFVAAGAKFVFVGPDTGLKGPPHIVQPLAHHNNHMHVRIPKSG
jgi:murein endopeptidase